MTTTVDKISNTIETSIEKKKYKKLDFDFFQGLFELILDIMELIEEFYKDKSGSVKKQIVISIGNQLVAKFYPEKLEFYNENVSEIIETIIQSFKVLSKLKNTSKCFCFFC